MKKYLIGVAVAVAVAGAVGLGLSAGDDDESTTAQATSTTIAVVTPDVASADVATITGDDTTDDDALGTQSEEDVASTEIQPEVEEPVTIVLKDFDVHPNITQAKAGRLTLEAVNKGKSIHELVILKTDLNPAALPRKEAKPQPGRVTEYLVNEDDARIETIDEIEEFPAGTSQKKTIVLGPGHYVLFCNIPGHYDKGMYASLHVSR